MGHPKLPCSLPCAFECRDHLPDSLTCLPSLVSLGGERAAQISFVEILRIVYQYAAPDEIETMLIWVTAEPEPEPEPEPELSQAAKKEINQLFKQCIRARGSNLFGLRRSSLTLAVPLGPSGDKGKNGTLELKELQEALVRA